MNDTVLKEDFSELLPSKISIARLFVQRLSLAAKHDQHKLTHELIYDHIEAAHIKHFNHPLPFKSYDSFRKYLVQNRKNIY